MPDVYEIVTSKFIEALEANIVPWQKPWTGEDMPINRVSGKPYSGINVMMLGLTAAVKGYVSNEWLTYKQATELGGTVRKGETSALVTFWKVSKYVKEGTDEERKGFMLRYYNVFNLEQCDGIQPRNARKTNARKTAFQVDTMCEAMLNGWNGPTVKTGGTVAAYEPVLDIVYMPHPSDFFSSSHYYSTFFHELVHSTGHKSRLNRDMSVSMRSDSYSKEELVAEIGAAFLCTHCGIVTSEVMDNSVSYVHHWLQRLKNDKKLILSASSQAQKAVEMIYHWREGSTCSDKEQVELSEVA